MMRNKPCKCGASAVKTVISQGGYGICFSPLCAKCFLKASALVSELLELTGMDPFGVPPTLRPEISSAVVLPNSPISCTPGEQGPDASGPNNAIGVAP